VNVTDTVTKNTVKKKINYGDGAIDSFFANSLPPWGRAGVGAVPHEYTQPGTYWLVQRLYGYTGCITQLDSARIFVTPGITDNDTILALQGSYTQHPSAEGALIIHSDGREEWRSNRDDSREPIELTWSGHPAAVKYSLSRNGTQLAEVDTPFLNYTDSVDRPQPFTYSIVAVDSCGTESASGRQISPMYLTGRASADNSIAVITFSPYTEQLREQEYVVFTEENRDWTTLNSLGANTIYEDKEFLVTQSDPSTPLRMTSLEKCYQVATRYGELGNILCLPYKPVIFIPTAFSPNADGLNDVYRPITFGIEHYEVKIYNRYGQKIAQFDQTSKGWDASDAAMGAYMVTIRAKGTDNEWYNEKSTVTVVR
jgi:gliding motility-associated-like protein